jgi:uncharacterized protein (DUF697 family)
VAGLKDIASVWNNIKEVDLKPIRESATSPVRIVLVGAPASGRHSLAEQMRTDPARPVMHTQSTFTLLSLETTAQAPQAHLVIMLVDATRPDFSEEQALAKSWSEAGKNVLVFVNKIDLVGGNLEGEARQGWKAARVIYGSVNDVSYLQREFIPAVLELLPQQHLALGRQFPLFRLPIARQLISETCFSNAAYSLSTGLAEVVPVLDLPLNLTDMLVLTKTQAFLAYKLGLLLGFSTRWQDYVTEFGSVVGTGFLWRQIARELVGLVPGWGIVPKVAVAYSGTYVVGNAILGWYLTGRNLSPKQMRALYTQAFARGTEYARKLADKIPRPRLGKGRREKLPAPHGNPELTAGEIVVDKTTASAADATSLLADEAQSTAPGGLDEASVARSLPEQPDGAEKARPRKRWPMILHRKKPLTRVAAGRVCPSCGKISSADASFCQYCGTRLEG